MTTMKPTSSSRFNSRTIAMMVIGILIVLVFGLVLVVVLPPDSTPDDSIIQLDGEGRLIGDEDAPILIREFADFRCPHCKDAAETLTPNIIDGYVETGQVRFEYVPVAVINEESVLSGQAALCAEDQGRFWSYHHTLFAQQGRNVFSIENLTQWATELELDEQAFRNCLTSSEYLAELNANLRDFQANGATGTPSFLVNGQLVSGAVSWEEMKATIDAHLASARGDGIPVP